MRICEGGEKRDGERDRTDEEGEARDEWPGGRSKGGDGEERHGGEGKEEEEGRGGEGVDEGGGWRDYIKKMKED